MLGCYIGPSNNIKLYSKRSKIKLHVTFKMKIPKELIEHKNIKK